MITLDPIWTAATQQRVFRALISAQSYAGRVVELAEPAEGARPVLAVLATLVDRNTTLCDTSDQLSDAERRMLEADAADVRAARFIVAEGRLAPAPDFEPTLGTLTRPDTGATIVLRVDRLSNEPTDDGLRLDLIGPGIEDHRTLTTTGLDRAWLDRRAAWVRHFPMGCDVLLCDASRIAALPRTTQVTIDPSPAHTPTTNGSL